MAADITLCGRDACPLARQCRRSRLVTKPGTYQVWALLGPVGDNGRCDSFVRAAETKESAYG